MTDTALPLPAPLIPPEVDLRGFEWMPYYGHHLFGSEFIAKASDAEFRAAHGLWWAAWNQVPAASLPDDDVALARFADFGRDVKGWRKVKANALHAFVKCSDGRLYHRFLAKQALKAWAEKQSAQVERERWRRKKKELRDKRAKAENPEDIIPDVPKDVPGDIPGDTTGTSPLDDARSPGAVSDMKGKERTGEKKEGSSVPNGTDGEPSLEAQIFRQGKTLLGRNAGGQITRLRRALAMDDAAVKALLDEAAGKGDPAEWVAGVLKRHETAPELDGLGLPVVRYTAEMIDAEYRQMGVES